MRRGRSDCLSWDGELLEVVRGEVERHYQGMIVDGKGGGTL